MSGETASSYLLSEPFGSKNKQGNQEGIDPEKLRDGLSKLVLTIVKILIDVIEKQAKRRVESGSLTSSEVERLGLAVMSLRRSFDDTSRRLGFNSSELDLPLHGHATSQNYNYAGAGHLLRAESASHNGLGLTAGTLVNLLDRLIDKKTTVAGEVTVSLAGIELVVLHLLASLEPVTSDERVGDQSEAPGDQKVARRSAKK